MKNEALRIKVAELCGYTLWGGSPVGTPFLHMRWCPPGEKGNFLNNHCPPDYPSDLNACAEFENMLTEEQVDDYLFALERGPRPAAFATAEQRCRAFVKTMEAK